MTSLRLDCRVPRSTWIRSWQVDSYIVKLWYTRLQTHFAKFLAWIRTLVKLTLPWWAAYSKGSWPPGCSGRQRAACWHNLKRHDVMWENLKWSETRRQSGPKEKQETVDQKRMEEEIWWVRLVMHDGFWLYKNDNGFVVSYVHLCVPTASIQMTAMTQGNRDLRGLNTAPRCKACRILTARQELKLTR